MDTAYDRALEEIGGNGVYQKRFDLIYNVVLVIFWSIIYMNIVLALTVLPHYCKVPENSTNISDYDWKIKYIPVSENDNNKVKFSDCLIYDNPGESTDTKECDTFTYDKTWYESTVPSENNWVCSKEILVANVYVYSRIGEIIGSIFFGWFGDRYGRRPTYIVTLFMIILGRTISIIGSNSYLIFVLGSTIAYLPSWSAVQSTSVISLEISSPERRTTTASLRYASFSFGVSLMGLIFWRLRSWKRYFIVTTAMPLPFLLFSWKFIESPRWLWLQGRSKECVEILKQIAKTNKAKLSASTEMELLVKPSLDTNNNLGVLALFSTWKLSLNTILQLCLWTSVTLCYTVLLMSSGEKSDGNPFFEFAWQSAAEIPGNFIGAWLADSLGRRYAGMISYSVSSVIWLIYILREIYVFNFLKDWWWMGTILMTLNRVSISCSFYIISLLNMELYPTCLRQSGMSLGNVLSSIASAIAPYILYMGRRVDSKLPAIILTIVSILGIMYSFLLPETRNRKLPETIKDASDFNYFNKNKNMYVTVKQNENYLKS